MHLCANGVKVRMSHFCTLCMCCTQPVLDLDSWFCSILVVEKIQNTLLLLSLCFQFYKLSDNHISKQIKLHFWFTVLYFRYSMQLLALSSFQDFLDIFVAHSNPFIHKISCFTFDALRRIMWSMDMNNVKKKQF